ncbi:MAG: hypothetical protein FJ271_21290 [Planctomycetes bacterium]|nr:hypothetical protein [Planctomycetota bacterium]
MAGESSSAGGPVRKPMRGYFCLLAALVAGGAVGGVVWLLWPPAGYRAWSLLHVDAFFPGVDGKDHAERFLRSQTALVKSRFVLNRVFDRPEIKKSDLAQKLIDPAQWLERQLMVETGPETLRISMEGSNPEMLKLLVSAVTNSHVEEVGNKDHINKMERLERLKTIWRKYEEKIQKHQDLIRFAVADDVNTNLKKQSPLRCTTSQSFFGSHQGAKISSPAELSTS